MAEPPLKRRRLSSDVTALTNEGADEVSKDSTEPTTPTRRASYLSPTKSSLARSHPNILARSPTRRSLTEPRGKLLRQELLGSRKSIGETGSKSAGRSTRTTQAEKPLDTESTERDGFAQAIAKSFQDVVPNQSTENDGPGSITRSPLHTRHAPNTVPRRVSDGYKAKSTAENDVLVPKLVKRPSAPERQTSETRNEPELPPTPLQLGIGTAPERPRGLASSSSIGSKSGSGKHRRRVRDRAAMPITSSPLKPRAARPVSPPDFSDIEEDERRIAREAPESDVEEIEIEKPNDRRQKDDFHDKAVMPAYLQEKQTLLSNMHSELELLRGDLAKLEALADRLQQDNDLEIDDASLVLLDLKHQRNTASQQSPETHPSFLKDPSAYLTLFAPGSLQMRHETTTSRIQKRPKVVQKLTLNAPAPWPSESMLLSFSLQIDAEDARIEDLMEVKSRNYSDYGNLHRWIDTRLHSQLHKKDMGGIVWGIGQYFKSCIQRAEAFQVIDEKYNDIVPNQSLKHNSVAVRDKLGLSRYLHKTQMVISQMDNEASTADSPKQILISYGINLTWTGDTTTSVDISLSGISAKAQTGAKELFQKLMVAQGVVGAFDAVWQLLEMGQRTQSTASTKGPRSRLGRSVSVL